VLVISPSSPFDLGIRCSKACNKFDAQSVTFFAFRDSGGAKNPHFAACGSPRPSSLYCLEFLRKFAKVWHKNPPYASNSTHGIRSFGCCREKEFCRRVTDLTVLHNFWRSCLRNPLNWENFVIATHSAFYSPKHLGQSADISWHWSCLLGDHFQTRQYTTQQHFPLVIITAGKHGI